MESKTFIFGIVGLIIAVGGAILVHSFQLESAKTELRRKQADVAALRQSISLAKDTVEQNAARVEQYRATVADHMAKKQEVDEVDREVTKQTRMLESAKAKWDVNVQLMTDALEQVRHAFRNESIPEIPLKIGESLKNCRFMNCKEGSAVFQHSSGTARLTSAQLPPELNDRLRPNFPPTLQLPKDPDASVPLSQTLAALPPSTLTDSGPVNEALSTPTPVPAANIPAASPAAQAAAAKAAAIADLKTQIRSTWTQKLAYEQMMKETSSPTEIAKSKDAANALQLQVDRMVKEIKQLESELQRGK